MKRLNQSIHDTMVKDAVNYLRSEGFTDIKADLGSYPQPTKIIWKATGQGHIPDVETTNGKHCILEVETCDSISDSHTADQWKLFSRFANEHEAEFWVVVPMGYKYNASSRLTELGIQAKIWELNN